MPWWRRRKRDEPEARQVSVSDPAVAEFFGAGQSNYSGVQVSESSSLGISAVYRAVSLISGTLASLPLKTFLDEGEAERKQVRSFLDNPAGPFGGVTPYEWKQTVAIHLLLHGKAVLLHLRNNAGAIIGLQPLHPLTVTTDAMSFDSNGRLQPKTFTVATGNGQTRTLTEGRDVTEILGMSLDGWHGLSVISVARNSFGTLIAGDRAAARMFSSGALQSGIVTPEEDVGENEAKDIKAGLDRKVAGWENAGQLAFVNRKLKFTPWTMSAEDAQFIQSRQFQIEEIARWFGVPPFELMQTEKQTSWGTGIEAQQRGLARGTLLGWTMRIEQRLSRRLGTGRFVEFDFSALERPTPEQEIRLLLEQVNGGLLTVNEARRIRNLPPVDGGDVLRAGQSAADTASEGSTT